LTAPASGVPDLTAIIIAHDVRDEVQDCLASLDEHRGDLELEVILVDNASTDGTAEAVLREHPGVQVVRLDHNAGMVARNAGLERATGRLRMFIDSDAALTAGALQTLVQVMDEHPEVGLAGPRLVYRDGSLQLSTRRYPPLLLPLLRRPPLGRWLEHGRTVREHVMDDEPHDRRRRVEYVIGACQVFRPEAQAAAGGIDRRIWFGHDDADWCFAMRMAGWDILYVPDAVVVHGYRRSSAAKPVSRHSLRQLQAHLYFQAKWRPHRARLRAEGRAMDAEAAARPELRGSRAAA
jgi:N-acetylglucosaminyl-diphospho-decaprenol L-rhamnosyltransferase